MHSQTRFVLAITLMFLVMLTTNVLFPPVIPAAPASPDSASAEGAEVPAAREPSEPVPTIPEVATSPTAVPERVEAEALPEERRVVVSSPLYRFA